MSNPFILIARIRVKEGKVEEYLKIAKEADDAVNASEPDMLIHTFDQDPTDPLEFTWSEVYRNSEAMLHHLNNCLLYTSPSPRDATLSRMPSSA